jgi:hypothetical protein
VAAADVDRDGTACRCGGRDSGRRRGPPRQRHCKPPRQRAGRRVHSRPGRSADRLGRPGRDHRAERFGQVHAAGGAARPGPADGRAVLTRAGSCRRRGRPGASAVSRQRPAAAGVRRRGARLGGRRRADAAGQVRAARGPRRPPGLVTVTRGADESGARIAAGARSEPAGPRRAHQPPGPAGDRAAGAGARRLRGHAAAGHPRPPDARRGGDHTAPGRGRRPGQRELTRPTVRAGERGRRAPVTGPAAPRCRDRGYRRRRSCRRG